MYPCHEHRYREDDPPESRPDSSWSTCDEFDPEIIAKSDDGKIHKEEEGGIAENHEEKRWAIDFLLFLDTPTHRECEKICGHCKESFYVIPILEYPTLLPKVFMIGNMGNKVRYQIDKAREESE